MRGTEPYLVVDGLMKHYGNGRLVEDQVNEAPLCAAELDW